MRLKDKVIPVIARVLVRDGAPVDNAPVDLDTIFTLGRNLTKQI
jgi:hypothetical protein